MTYSVGGLYHKTQLINNLLIANSKKYENTVNYLDHIYSGYCFPDYLINSLSLISMSHSNHLPSTCFVNSLINDIIILVSL